jgi:hypothetical protein
LRVSNYAEYFSELRGLKKEMKALNLLNINPLPQAPRKTNINEEASSPLAPQPSSPPGSSDPDGPISCNSHPSNTATTSKLPDAMLAKLFI